MSSYKVLNRQVFHSGDFSIVPIRQEDRYDIMRWRNEQIYHLRQDKPLTKEDQDFYFSEVVSKLFDQDQPTQILFSYLKGDECIGYGGLVHINWIDRNAEISFVLNTKLEEEFETHWVTYLDLIEKVAFVNLSLHKIYTYAFDLRPRLYSALEEASFTKEAVLKEHCFFDNKYIDVIYHSKINHLHKLIAREANSEDARLLFDWANDPVVRENSVHQENIIWDEHKKWFQSKLESKETKIFIFQLNDSHVGQLRLDLVDDHWVIDYSIDQDFRGQGLGKAMVAIIANRREFKPLKAFVKESNVPSFRVFESLSFEQSQERVNDLVEFILK